MPQVDFESLVSSCAGGYSDGKVSCETVVGDVAGDEQDWPPPESIWLSGDAEFDWWDRNAVVYERKESTKGSSIFNSSTNLNPNSSNSNSQRFSKNLKSKAAIIGLPKSQKSAFADATISRRHHHHHRQGTTTLFPKRSASVGRSGPVAVFEPSSPKVSCMGRVRSRRDRNRRLRTRQRSSSSSSAAVTITAAAVERQKSSRRGRRRTGFFESVRAIFRSRKSVQKTDLVSEDSNSKKKNKNKKRSSSRKARGSSGGGAGGGDSIKTVVSTQNDASFEDSVSSAPPGLGSLNRFASGRRSDW